MHCICVGVSAFVDTENIESTKKKMRFIRHTVQTVRLLCTIFPNHFIRIILSDQYNMFNNNN